MPVTKEAIIEMLQRINGANGITRTEEEIQELAEDLWKNACEVKEDSEDCLIEGIDLENYDIIGIHPQTTNRSVIILRNKREDSVRPWCLHYRGTERQFKTAEEALQHFKSRGWVFIGQNK